MGLRTTQGDEKQLLSSNDSLWKRPPPLCHLDRSVPGNPGERSGEISVWVLLLGNVFLAE
jgi:hypothetical protein